MSRNEKIWIFFSVLVGVTLSWAGIYAFKTGGFHAVENEASVVKATPLTDGGHKSKYFYLNIDDGLEPKVSAKAYLVGDLNTGEVILSKNQSVKYPIASVSKLMTALVASEIKDPENIAVISKSALSTHGTNGEFRLGEKIQTSDLLYPLLLESSNDAAEALAEHFGRESFISKMNREAEILKMSDTSYDDPSGLSINNQSTVADMFKLAGYLVEKKPELISITDQRSYKNKIHSWSNISQFLRADGYIGGKSGYTDPARETVVSLFNVPLSETGSRPIAITLLQSADRKKDVESILKYLQKNIYYGGASDANTNWVEEKVGLPSIKDPDFVTLVFGGDIMVDRGVRNSVINNFGGDYSALFEKADVFEKSDIAFANLEGPVSDQGADRKNLYSFRMDPSAIPALKGAGFSVLSVANNHVGDWGRDAYADTLARLKENEILYAGGGNNKTEAQTPTIIEKYGMKIGFLGFSDKGPDYMAAGIDKVGILLASDPNFDQIVQNAAKQVDYLVVSFHFGEEYQTVHNARQELLAHEAVDDGAKLVIGAHPHVAQDSEVYKNSFIAYSLGNLIFDQKFSVPTMQGLVLEIKIKRDGSMTVKKDTSYLNAGFQIDKIVKGEEQKITLQSE